MTPPISRRVLLGGAGVPAISRAFLNSALLFDTNAYHDVIVNLVNTSSAQLPIWYDSQGTVYFVDGVVKRGISWSPTGYVIVENGVVVEERGTL